MQFATRRTRRRASDDERILPLINVVFLLLIIFMIAGQLSATDPFRISPPSSASGGTAGERDMKLLLGADGRLALDGKELTRAALRTAVETRLEDAPDARLELKADGGAEATEVVAVMEVLREAGLTRLTLLTVPEAG